MTLQDLRSRTGGKRKDDAAGVGGHASPSTSGGSGGGKPVSKRSQVQCRGCRKAYDQSLIPLNSAFCAACKRALDRIGYLAGRQGDSAKVWLAKTRSDPDGVHRLLKNYFEKCPAPKMGRASNTSKWSLSQYWEEVKSVSGAYVEDIGAMMWRGLYVEHRTSAAGGFQSKAKAESEWSKMVEEIRSSPESHIWDNCGPNDEEPLQIRIHREKLVVLRSGREEAHGVTNSEKSIKKASDQQIDNLVKRSQKDHQTVNADTMKEITRRLAKHGDGFSTNAVEFDDVTDLLPEGEPEDQSTSQTSKQTSQEQWLAST